MKISKTLQLKIVEPSNISWDEFSGLLRQMQKTITPLYNQASAEIYLHLQNPATKLKRGNESKIVRQWTSSIAYPPISKAVCNSYIALGTMIKLQANFSGQKIWDIKNGVTKPPFILSKSFPIVFNVQRGFKITTKDADYFIDIPFLKYVNTAAPDNFKPWKKFDFQPKKKTHIQLLLSTKERKKEQRVDK